MLVTFSPSALSSIQHGLLQADARLVRRAQQRLLHPLVPEWTRTPLVLLHGPLQ